MAVLAPTRRCRLDCLLGWMRGKILARTRQIKISLVERCFTNEKLEKPWPFKPPMTEQLCIEGRHYDWFDIVGGELAKLCAPLLQEMGRVCLDRPVRGCRIVKFLVFLFSCDAVIFDARKFPDASCDGSEMF